MGHLLGWARWPGQGIGVRKGIDWFSCVIIFSLLTRTKLGRL